MILETSSGGIGSMLPFLAMVVIACFLLIRMRKQQKEGKPTEENKPNELNSYEERYSLNREETIKKEEELYKKNYYRNVESIKRNVQFFFWLAIISIIITFFLSLVQAI